MTVGMGMEKSGYEQMTAGTPYREVRFHGKKPHSLRNETYLVTTVGTNTSKRLQTTPGYHGNRLAITCTDSLPFFFPFLEKIKEEITFNSQKTIISHLL